MARGAVMRVDDKRLHRTRRPLLDRALEKVAYDHGCWSFKGAMHHGYGYIQRGGSEGTVPVHRAVYEALVGPIPDGMHLDHVCRNRACCNPLHLDPVTPEENSRRGASGEWQKRKTHCPKGHEYTPGNLRLRTGRPRSRECLTCTRIDNRDRERRKSAKRRAA